ncbi:MAG: DUF4407 domain-containing protein [Trebonia sp.]
MRDAHTDDFDDIADQWSPGSRGSRFGDFMITVAGADKTELNARSADRAYYIGMGTSLLLAATISAVSLMEATSIAFGVHFVSPALIIAGLIYFGLLLGVDRWLVSDQTTGFAAEASRGFSVVSAWFRHFFVELLKIAPRLFVAFLSSLLFANFLMLAIFGHEIQQQLRNINQQRVAQYDVKIQAEAQRITSQANGIIGEATTAEESVQEQYNTDQGIIKTAETTEQNDLTKLNAEGITCTEQPQYVVKTNPNTGLDYNVFAGDTLVCPPQIQDVVNTYNKVVAEYPETQAEVDTAKNKIATNYGVAAQEQVIKNAPATAKTELANSSPQLVDGLLARMQALELLTTKPTRTCPALPTVADLANNPACTSQYSADAAALHTTLRLWLLAFEILPVVLKFINALLPRRGYAWAMTARDLTKRGKAKGRIDRARLQAETDLATFTRREHARLEEEGALEEYKLRELARQERRLGLQRLRDRFTAALAGSEPTRAFRSHFRRGVPSGRNGEHAVQQSGYDNPPSAPADRGPRVTESEDFLL